MSVENRKMMIIEALKKGAMTNNDLEQLYKSNGHVFNKNKLNRDYNALLSDGWTIVKPKKGIYALENTDDKQNTIARFLSHINAADFFRKVSIEQPKNIKYIHTDIVTVALDYNVFQLIFDAIIAKKNISFQHINYYQDNQQKEYTISPYLIKEFKNRWYVIGESKNGLRSFSIDRISEVELLDNYNSCNFEDLNELIDSSYGVSFSTETPKITHIKIDISQKPFIESVPLHETQEIIEENDQYFILKLFINENLELKQELLKYGAWAEVLKPAPLRKWFQDEIKKMLKAYS